MATSRKRPTRGATRAPAGSGLPASALLGAGFLAGIICTVLVFRLVSPQSPEQPADGGSAAATTASKGRETQPEKVTSSTKYDFFTLLPEREVIVPDETPAVQPKPSKPVASTTESSTSTEPSAAASQAPRVEPALPPGERYILQAGSFRGFEDAQSRRAQILLLGLDAKVESVEANGDRWHRVYVGPFSSHNTLSSARSKLINESIDTLVVRQKN